MKKPECETTIGGCECCVNWEVYLEHLRVDWQSHLNELGDEERIKEVIGNIDIAFPYDFPTDEQIAQALSKYIKGEK